MQLKAAQVAEWAERPDFRQHFLIQDLCDVTEGGYSKCWWNEGLLGMNHFEQLLIKSCTELGSEPNQLFSGAFKHNQLCLDFTFEPFPHFSQKQTELLILHVWFWLLTAVFLPIHWLLLTSLNVHLSVLFADRTKWFTIPAKYRRVRGKPAWCLWGKIQGK